MQPAKRRALAELATANEMLIEQPPRTFMELRANRQLGQAHSHACSITFSHTQHVRRVLRKARYARHTVQGTPCKAHRTRHTVQGTPCKAHLQCHAMRRHATPCHATQHHATPRNATPRNSTTRHATTHHVMPRNTMPHKARRAMRGLQNKACRARLATVQGMPCKGRHARYATHGMSRTARHTGHVNATQGTGCKKARHQRRHTMQGTLHCTTYKRTCKPPCKRQHQSAHRRNTHTAQLAHRRTCL